MSPLHIYVRGFLDKQTATNGVCQSVVMQISLHHCEGYESARGQAQTSKSAQTAFYTRHRMTTGIVQQSGAR